MRAQLQGKKLVPAWEGLEEWKGQACDRISCTKGGREIEVSPIQQPRSSPQAGSASIHLCAPAARMCKCLQMGSYSQRVDGGAGYKPNLTLREERCRNGDTFKPHLDTQCETQSAKKSVLCQGWEGSGLQRGGVLKDKEGFMGRDHSSRREATVGQMFLYGLSFASPALGSTVPGLSHIAKKISHNKNCLMRDGCTL